MRGNSTYIPTVTTVDGSASASYLVVEGYNIVVSAQSSLARSSSVEINILGDAINGAADNIQGTAEEETAQPAENPSSTGEPADNPSETEEPQTPSWRNWGFSLIVIVFISVIAYQVGASSGLVRWGIRWSLSSLIAGLFIYNYITLELPGVVSLFPNGVSRISLGLCVLLGSSLAWLFAFLYQKFFDS